MSGLYAASSVEQPSVADTSPTPIETEVATEIGSAESLTVTEVVSPAVASTPDPLVDQASTMVTPADVVDLISRPAATVEEQRRLDPANSTILNGREKIVQRFIIDSVQQDGRDVTPQLDAVIEQFGYENAVAVIMVMARYTSHALMVNCLQIGPPVPSIFEDGI